MNYKKIIKNRQLRFQILNWLRFVPDSLMLHCQYYIKTGRWPDFQHPRRFTEKLQLYKMRYRNPDMLRCTDKLEVRNFVAEKGYEKYLVPIIGVYDKVSDINFNSLPNQFVAKTTDGSGGNQVFICKNKNELLEEDFKKRMNKWLSAPKIKKSISREWAYENDFSRRIFIEELIGKEIPNCDLYDYKFFCFNGIISCIYGISDRKLGQSVQLGVYDSDFNKLDVYRNDERPQKVPLQKPSNFEEMKTLAESLSKGFPHVSIDLYNVAGKIYFGEMTFYDGSGYMTYTPDSFDFELGKHFTEY